VWVPAEDPAFATRLAHYCARHPVALRRLTYPAEGGRGTYRSDKSSGPTAGAETLDALAFLARVVSHIPNKGQVLQRSYGWYANRTRGSRRWAELLRRIFAVDPLRCPRCGTPMRIVAFLTAPPVIDRRPPRPVPGGGPAPSPRRKPRLPSPLPPAVGELPRARG
jgi:hypothetical protein